MVTQSEGLAARLAQAVEADWAKQVSWLGTLASFPSLRGQEAPCQDWLAGQFAARGWAVDRFTLAEVEIEALPGFSPVFEADYEKAVQVVATVPSSAGGGRSLILQGHIDVVPPGPLQDWAHDPFAPRIDGTWISGRGTADMKVGVTEIVFALDALRAVGLRPAAPVHVETVSEEECTGNGALGTLARGYRADACLIAEAVGNRLQRAQLGSIWFRVRLSGTAAHILEAGRGASAILAMYDFITALQGLADRTNEEHRGSRWYGHMAAPVSFSVGRIRGGDWIGMVPSWCEIDCRIGILPGQSLEAVRRAILDTVAACAREKGNEASADVTWVGFQAEPYVQEPGSAAEAALALAHKTVFGTELESFSMPATCDVRLYGFHYGIPTLCYGSLGEGLHSPRERADLESMKKTTVVLALFIAEWCGTAPLNSADHG
ncbi:ArgE/DapE family deacylase [Gluconacetobacter sp. Hr-1-5]|uniref:ArgE/DapE family deacylase n=1 Tax=Gluconacetobacter sp. Hr-1-5 TaxID=3395370 RepID=UPI003B521289